jgi:hypothetical protein
MDGDWHLPDRRALTISPELENRRFNEQSKIRTSLFMNGLEIKANESETDANFRQATFTCAWPAPFKFLSCITELNTGQYVKVLQETEAWVNRLTGEAHAPLERAWVWPKVLANTEGALLDVQGRYGIDAASIQELMETQEFQKIRYALIPVRRVQGWLGYFWWEFYQDLVNKIYVGNCKLCSSVLRGGAVTDSIVPGEKTLSVVVDTMHDASGRAEQHAVDSRRVTW